LYTWNNPVNYLDPDGRLAIGVIIGGVIGGISGISGAIVQGGGIIDILVSATTGLVGGAVIGFFDPTEGIVTTMIVAGGIGAVGNLTGQLLTQLIHGKSWDCIGINIGAIIGSMIGSSIGGGMGNVAANMAINMGASSGITSLVSAIGMVPSALGGAIGEELTR
jgi:hypothetical protein